jgi:hypothetical protein
MKKKPSKLCTWRNDNCYEIRFLYHYRHPKCQNERRQNKAAKADGYYVRPNRRKLPSSWDDLNYSFNYGKCWKRFTRRKKQYDD